MEILSVSKPKMNSVLKHKLQNQVAVVTGGGSGIGAGVAHCMAEEGAMVIINYPDERTFDMAQQVCYDVKEAGGKAAIKMADVTNEKQVEKMFAEVIEEYKTVDILVNNAGLQKDANFHEMTLAQWNLVLNVNLTGQFLCAREAIREFLRRGIDVDRSVAAGKIICMSSVHEVIPWAGHANYAASKGGVMMMMKTLAQEYAPKKIRINSIGPGAIKTPINTMAWSTPEAEENLLKLIPFKRVGETRDIGKAAVWLASDDSDYVNGTTLIVDGGMCLYPGFEGNG